MDMLGEMSRDDVKMILYACSTGAPEGSRQGSDSDLRDHYGWWRAMMEAARDYSPNENMFWPHEFGIAVWGANSFADYIRNGLHARGRTEVEVIGHSEVADAFTFPFVLRFRGNGAVGPLAGGEWVIDPGPEGNNMDVVRSFRRVLRDQPALRYRYPWLTTAEILAEIGL